MLFRTFAPFNVDQRVSRQYRLSLFLPWAPPLLARPTLWHTLAIPDAPLPCASLFAFPGIPSTVLGVAAWQQHVRIRHSPRSWLIWNGADWQRVCRSDWPQCAMVVGRASSGEGIRVWALSGRRLGKTCQGFTVAARMVRGWETLLGKRSFTPFGATARTSPLGWRRRHSMFRGGSTSTPCFKKCSGNSVCSCVCRRRARASRAVLIRPCEGIENATQGWPLG